MRRSYAWLEYSGTSPSVFMNILIIHPFFPPAQDRFTLWYIIQLMLFTFDIISLNRSCVHFHHISFWSCWQVVGRLNTCPWFGHTECQRAQRGIERSWRSESSTTYLLAPFPELFLNADIYFRTARRVSPPGMSEKPWRIGLKSPRSMCFHSIRWVYQYQPVPFDSCWNQWRTTSLIDRSPSRCLVSINPPISCLLSRSASPSHATGLIDQPYNCSFF